MGLFYLCGIDELPEGDARGFDPRKQGFDSIFVVRKNGVLHAYRDACPHYGDTPMAWRKNAYLDGGATNIVCAAHGAQFAIDSGICTLGPCLGQVLTRVPLRTNVSKHIYAELEDL